MISLNDFKRSSEASETAKLNLTIGFNVSSFCTNMDIEELYLSGNFHAIATLNIVMSRVQSIRTFFLRFQNPFISLTAN
nr:hypothetical protein [Gracilimonas sp.]